jgi:hypothetical protein
MPVEKLIPIPVELRRFTPASAKRALGLGQLYRCREPLPDPSQIVPLSHDGRGPGMTFDSGGNLYVVDTCNTVARAA